MKNLNYNLICHCEEWNEEAIWIINEIAADSFHVLCKHALILAKEWSCV